MNYSLTGSDYHCCYKMNKPPMSNKELRDIFLSVNNLQARRTLASVLQNVHIAEKDILISLVILSQGTLKN